MTEAEQEVRMVKPQLMRDRYWALPGTGQAISCTPRASTIWFSSVCSTQLPLISIRVGKHRLEVGTAEPLVFRLPKILHCKLCLQLAINLPKV